jgi:hypothetical protein
VLQDVETAHARQTDVQQHDVERTIAQERERVRTIAGGLHDVTGSREEGRQRMPEPPVIVDEQDAAATGLF